MLQVLLDPSMIDRKKNDGKSIISVSISGLFFEKENLPTDWESWLNTTRPSGSNNETETIEIEKIINPWTWDKPSRVRVYLLEYNETTNAYSLVKATDGTYKEFKFELNNQDTNNVLDSDLEIVKRYFQEKLRMGVWNLEDSENIFKFNPNQLLSKLSNTDFEVNDEDELIVSKEILRTAVAQFAQQLSPLNQILKLVFFAEGSIEIPQPENDKKNYFVAFPMSDSEIWHSQQQPVVSGSNVTLAYESNRIVTCPITEIPKQTQQSTTTDNEQNRNHIKLRDPHGNFDGGVTITVSDEEDWTAGIMNRLGQFFDLPNMYIKFLASNLQSNNEYVFANKFISKSHNFLLATLRDALGLGLQNTLRDDCVAKRVFDKLSSPAVRYENFRKDLENFEKTKYTSVEDWQKLLESLESTNSDINDYKNCIEHLNQSLKIVTESFITDNIKSWISAWIDFTSLLNSNKEIQKKIVELQYREFSSNPSNTSCVEAFTSAFDEKNFSSSLLEFQLEGLASCFASELLKADMTTPQSIIDNWVETIVGKHYEKRLNANSTPSNYPSTDNPFDNQNNLFEAFKNFCKIELKKYFEFNTEALLPGINKTYDIPPPVRIQVDGIGADNDNQDDLSDEIAGYILLMKREGHNDWRYLNWAKPEINKADGTKVPLSNSYLIPEFLPVTDGLKKPFLTISNEKLSLVAGHNTYTDTEFESYENQQDYIAYNFDKDKAAYALWYGHNYRFAAYVALNSGALPPALRNGSLNSPKLEPAIENNPDPYHHLRRVPVSKVRVKAERVGGLPVLAPPKALKPLAFELSAWKSNQLGETVADVTKIEQEQSHFLLAKSESFDQQSITLTIQKPTTSFWNWYAWMGGELNNEEGKEVIKTALVKDLQNRETAITDNGYGKGKTGDVLCDPAASGKIVIIVEQLFPIVSNNTQTVELSFNNNEAVADPELKLNLIVSNEKYGSNNNDVKIDTNSNTITIKQGVVARIKISALIEKKYFDKNGTDKKFHSWMDKLFLKGENDNPFIHKHDDIQYYLSLPEELWFEAAKVPEVKPEILWEKLEPRHIGDKVILSLDKSGEKELAYLSDVTVKHQVWYWNGRLEDVKLLEDGLKLPDIDPEHNGSTTDAMKWEAWAFGQRPDSDCMVHETNITAYQEGYAKVQDLFEDHRPGEEKALYYRFGLTAYSRYRSLGGVYDESFEAKITVENTPNPWKRYLRKCSISKPLPKPSVRFILPLTRSIEECPKTNEIQTAPLLIVLNDRWFAEAGLAEQLEVGVDIVDNPGTSGGSFMQVGNDPTLTGSALAQWNGNTGNDDKDDKDVVVESTSNGAIAVFKNECIKGPAGLTYQPKIEYAKMIGSSFVLKIPDVSGLLVSPRGDNINKLHAYAMMQMAVRRTLRKKFCENEENIETLRSEWSAKEWVQYLPAVNSLIPHEWRKQVALEGYVTAGFNDHIIQINDTQMPRFVPEDTSYEERMERFLIITKKIFDIGGQPTEEYLATYRWEKKSAQFIKNDGEVFKADESSIDGYARMMLVRVPKHLSSDDPRMGLSIWKRLFGEYAEKETIDFNKVHDDPTAALPLVTGRIEMRFGHNDKIKVESETKGNSVTNNATV